MLNLKEIITSTKGRLIGKNTDLSADIKRIVIDSRSVERNDVFVAIKGERVDGHHFIEEAIRKGAAGIVCSDVPNAFAEDSPGCVFIRVKDTTRALGRIAFFYRRKFKIPVIAVTGSAGKTTTKEIIAQVLSAKRKVLKNKKSFNNQYGVPLTLLELDCTHQAAVVEAGTNHKGEILALGRIIAPDIIVYTNIGDSHLEGFGSRTGVWKEKSQLMRTMASSGTIIFNQDDPFLKRITSGKKKVKKISYGIDSPCDYQARSITTEGTAQRFCVNGHEMCLNMAGEHQVANALAAIVCGRLLKISWKDIAKSLQTIENCEGRQNVSRFSRLTVINDTYNANPLSFRRAVEVLAQWPNHDKKIVVCGDMLELGEGSRRLHQELGRIISSLAIDAVFSFGHEARWIAQTAAEKRKEMVCRHYGSLPALQQQIVHWCDQFRCVVLVKGSRGMKMERVVDFLKTYYQNQ